MKLGHLIFYGLVIASLTYFDIIDLRPTRAFVNTPFDEQMRYYPQFAAWKNEFEGKLNLIFLRYGRLIRRRALRPFHQGLPSRPQAW
jgi:hypothetical protein